MREKTTFLSKNLKETRRVAQSFLSSLEASNSATVVFLQGDLGAGKTAFVKELAKNLNIKQNIISPTFVLAKKYKIKNQNFKELLHIDAYRFEKKEEVKVLLLKEEIKNKELLILIEWPEKIFKEIKPNHTIKCQFIDEITRKYLWIKN